MGVEKAHKNKGKRENSVGYKKRFSEREGKNRIEGRRGNGEVCWAAE